MADSYREDWREVSAHSGIDEELLREYDLLPDSVTPVGLALSVQGPRKSLIVKRTSLSSSRLQRVYQVVERLAERGVAVARFVKTKYGDPFVVRTDGVYYATALAPGRPPRMENEVVLLAATELLARWHSGAQTEPGELLSIERYDLQARLLQDLARLETYREQALAHTDPGELDDLFLALREPLEQEIRHVLRHLSATYYQDLCRTSVSSGVLCHGSFVRQNLLWHEGRLLALDHDHLYAGPQVLDVAALLRRYIRTYDWDADLLSQALVRYERIRPLSAEEQALLPALLSIPDLVLQILRVYYEGASDASENDIVDALEREWKWYMARRQTITRLFGQSFYNEFADETPLRIVSEPQSEEQEEELVPGLTRFWRTLRRSGKL